MKVIQYIISGIMICMAGTAMQIAYGDLFTFTTIAVALLILARAGEISAFVSEVFGVRGQNVHYVAPNPEMHSGPCPECDDTGRAPRTLRFVNKGVVDEYIIHVPCRTCDGNGR